MRVQTHPSLRTIATGQDEIRLYSQVKATNEIYNEITLSTTQRSLCATRRLGIGEKSTRGAMGRGKRRERLPAFTPSHHSCLPIINF